MSHKGATSQVCVIVPIKGVMLIRNTLLQTRHIKDILYTFSYTDETDQYNDLLLHVRSIK